MTTLAHTIPQPFSRPAEASAPTLSDAQTTALNHLRLAALSCRTAARLDLTHSCALLHLEGEVARRTYVSTFVSGLADALGRQPIWYRPGEAALSFDEAWVIRCLDRIAARDDGSVAFLLQSRVRAPDRRFIGFLLARIREQFWQG